MTNIVHLIGNLGQDPSMSETGSGVPKCRFSLATNEVRKGGEKVTTWHTCFVYGDQAVNFAQICTKGALVFVTGSLFSLDGEYKGVTTRDKCVSVRSWQHYGHRDKAQSPGQPGASHTLSKPEPDDDFDEDEIPF